MKFNTKIQRDRAGQVIYAGKVIEKRRVRQVRERQDGQQIISLGTRVQ